MNGDGAQQNVALEGEERGGAAMEVDDEDFTPLSPSAKSARPVSVMCY